MKLVEVKKKNFWQGYEAKFLVLIIIQRCEVILDWDYNQLGVEVDLDFFLS
jgi:hypothetical protein